MGVPLDVIESADGAGGSFVLSVVEVIVVDNTLSGFDDGTVDSSSKSSCRQSWHSFLSGGYPSSWASRSAGAQCFLHTLYDATSGSFWICSGSLSQTMSMYSPQCFNSNGFGIYSSSSGRRSKGSLPQSITRIPLMISIFLVLLTLPRNIDECASLFVVFSFYTFSRCFPNVWWWGAYRCCRSGVFAYYKWQPKRAVHVCTQCVVRPPPPLKKRCLPVYEPFRCLRLIYRSFL